MTPPVVLTIAGSDSGGGAGIQADLKTFAAQRCFGASVITAVTAQNTKAVTGVHQLPPEAVAQQLAAVLDDLPVAAVKTGMLGTAEVADVIAARARAGDLPNLVVDPVLVSSTGATLGVVAAIERLLPYALVATPNVAEAAALLGRPVTTVEEMTAAARDLAAGGPRCVVVTGGDLVADQPAGTAPDRAAESAAAGEPSVATEAVDAVWTAQGGHLLRAPRVISGNVHGSGCTFSAAIAAQLALGAVERRAVEAAKSYVTQALTGATGWRVGGGIGPLDHLLWG